MLVLNYLVVAVGLMSGYNGIIALKDFDTAPIRRMRLPPSVKPKAIFTEFLRNLLDLLSTTFPERKLPRYCRILSRHLEHMPFRYTRKLSRHVRDMSKIFYDDLKNEIITYKQELDKSLPHRTSFLNAFNEVFTLRENQMFDDYIYDLKNYGTKDKLFIDEETHKLLNDVIVGSVLRLSERDQKDLFKKLKKAVKEYED